MEWAICRGGVSSKKRKRQGEKGGGKSRLFASWRDAKSEGCASGVKDARRNAAPSSARVTDRPLISPFRLGCFRRAGFSRSRGGVISPKGRRRGRKSQLRQQTRVRARSQGCATNRRLRERLTPVDSTLSPQTLPSRDLHGLPQFIGGSSWNRFRGEGFFSRPRVSAGSIDRKQRDSRVRRDRPP